MNGLDLVILAICLPAAIGGFRLGLVARASSWLGLAVGLAASARVASAVSERVASRGTTLVLVAVAMILLAGGLIGQILGLIAGSRLRITVPYGWPRKADRALGTACGLGGVAIAVWMALPIMQRLPDWPAEQAAGSSLSRSVVSQFGDPPDTVQRLADVVGAERWRSLMADLEAQLEGVDPPASHDLSASAVDRASNATVRVSSNDCGDAVAGSGYVLRNGFVVTAAHVIAGMDDIKIDTRGTDSPGTIAATVLVYEPTLDLAILQADLPTVEPLELSAGRDGSTGGVFGYPDEGNSLRIEPFEIGSLTKLLIPGFTRGSGTDKRTVHVLATSLTKGFSGGPVVDTNGDVVGTAFAIVSDDYVDGGRASRSVGSGKGWPPNTSPLRWLQRPPI